MRVKPNFIPQSAPCLYLKVTRKVRALRKHQVAAAVRSRAVGYAVDDDADFLPAGVGAPDGRIATGVAGLERFATVQHALLSPASGAGRGRGCAACCCAGRKFLNVSFLLTGTA